MSCKMQGGVYIIEEEVFVSNMNYCVDTRTV